MRLPFKLQLRQTRVSMAIEDYNLTRYMPPYLIEGTSGFQTVFAE